ncbi:hypothetical protein JOD97_001578 [Duganella sp. 1411]|uniref:PEP-CTERM sorting domain-containing protein n=1 Tax=Duganella sp. 1411 TaxID=2806572 RepID=UPI001B5334D9|nr:PEP-CTERM sorting domain-containing protein [Duganella sp. 1411]MBP1203564.1 hypothetical protein [Duganella sp. 1411]
MNFFKLLRVSLCSVAFTVLSAGPAFAGMSGDLVSAFHLFPDMSTVANNGGFFGHGQVTDDGVTFTRPYFFSVHINDTQIVIDGFAGQFDHQRFSEVPFNGINLSFDTERRIPNFMINAATNWDEFTADRIYVASNQLFLNFENLDVTTSTRLVLDLTDTYPAPGFPGQDVSPVPEPGNYAMLLAGLALMGVEARRRKRS